MSDIITAG